MDAGEFLHRRKSEDLQRKGSVVHVASRYYSTQKNGCGNHMIAAAVFSFETKI